MKAVIRDAEQLRSLNPIELSTYMRATGWTPEPDSNVWTWGDHEVLVPTSRTSRDFALRVSEVLRELEAVEQRSQLQIFADLSRVATDVIRISANSPMALDGTVLIEDGIGFVNNIRELVLASACSAIKAKPIHASRKPDDAVAFMKKCVRLGQTERGSYVFTVLCLIPPRLVVTAEEAGQLFDPPMEPEPYERKVTTTLVQSLHAVVEASQVAARLGRIDPFISAVALGVSTNLCDAIVGLGENADPDKGLPITFSWSRSRPLVSTVHSNLVIAGESLPIIKEASREMKQTAPESDTLVRGHVLKLESEAPEEGGKIHIADYESKRRIVVLLDAINYHTALNAHGENRIVSCVGDVIKAGRSCTIRNAHSFVVEGEEALP